MKNRDKMLKATVMLSLLATTASQAMAAEPVKAEQKAAAKKEPSGPSLYLQCDGNPNNMAAGESLARFVGAVTLLGIFAPSAESPDPLKRKFGEEGVTACSGLLSGEKMEGNVLRRLPLILARAVHKIEAKDYAGAVEDVAMARQEATTANLTGNPYFARSMGLSFSLIEYEALIRKGDLAAAREVNARTVEQYKFSYYPLIAARERTVFYKDISPAELKRLDSMSRFGIASTVNKATLLMDGGRFAEAADMLEGVLAYYDSFVDDEDASLAPIITAVLQGEAGNWERAEALYRRAHDNFDKRIAEGKPENDRANLIEWFDFYKVLKLSADGDLKMARRLFASRSQWSAPFFGQVLDMNRRLRKDATPDEMFGALEKSADEMWTIRAENAKAAMLETDKNNKTLFGFLLPYASMANYERLSSRVWNTNKSRLLSKEPLKRSVSYSASIFDADSMTQVDALLLHAALQAKARGKNGFTYAISDEPHIGFVRFGNQGDPGIVNNRYLDADAVIAELRQVIPSPAEIEARSKKTKAP